MMGCATFIVEGDSDFGSQWLAQLESDGWHVDYNLKDPRLKGGGPHYVIDAASGAILSKRYAQQSSIVAACYRHTERSKPCSSARFQSAWLSRISKLRGRDVASPGVSVFLPCCQLRRELLEIVAAVQDDQVAIAFEMVGVVEAGGDGSAQPGDGALGFGLGGLGAGRR